MNIQSSTKAPILRNTQPQVARPEEDSGSGTKVVIDVTEIGSAVKAGAEFALGATSAVLSTPRNILAPLSVGIAESGSDRSLANTEVAVLLSAATLAGAGAGYALTSNLGLAAFGAAAGFVGTVAVGAAVSSAKGSNSTLFSYDNIHQARSEAYDSTEGSDTRKKGAAFTAGFSAAFKESYQNGAEFVDKTTSFIANGTKGITEFAAGAVGR